MLMTNGSIIAGDVTNETLMYRVGVIVGTTARAIYLAWHNYDFAVEQAVELSQAGFTSWIEQAQPHGGAEK